jgi:hypothetical protein
MTETERDERDARYFYAGWFAALREVRLRGDRAVGEFLIEQLDNNENGNDNG